MVLRQVFTPVDQPRYEFGSLWGTDMGFGPGVSNGYLVSGSRVYGEELQCITRNTRAGAISVHGNVDNGILQAPNPFSDYTIRYMAQTFMYSDPGYAMSEWLFDAEFGRYFLRIPPGFPATFHNHDHFLPVSTPFSLFDNIFVDPSANTWCYGSEPDITYGGAVRFNSQTMAVSTSDAVLHASYLDARGNATVGIEDFAVDVLNDRLFVRWTSNNVGEVSCYRISTREYLFALWMPNLTSQILIADSKVFVVDVADWIGVFDYALGEFLGMCRNPRTAFVFGRTSFQTPVYGWDPFFKRLLCVRAYANDATTGASNISIVGFRPVPDAMIVSPPIPRNVPRANRRITLVSHVFGSGGEPVGARPATISGATALITASDSDGDVIVPLTCGAPGSETINVAVNDGEL